MRFRICADSTRKSAKENTKSAKGLCVRILCDRCVENIGGLDVCERNFRHGHERLSTKKLHELGGMRIANPVDFVMEDQS